MYISKTRYTALCERIEKLEHAISEIEAAKEEAKGKLVGLEEYISDTSEMRKKEKAYFEGLQNVFGFGVTNGV